MIILNGLCTIQLGKVGALTVITSYGNADGLVKIEDNKRERE